MMNSFSSVWPIGYFALAAIHALGMIALLVGFIFLMVWAVKKLHADQLKRWGIISFVVGAIVCLLTVASVVSVPMWGADTGAARSHFNRMRQFMDSSWQDDDQAVSDDTGTTNQPRGMMMQQTHNDAAAMTMDDMTAVLNGKTGDAFDKAFLATMIVHHQGAIDMAKAAQVSSGHAELKAMANAIITAQQSEIDMMKQWQKAWGYTK